MKIMTIIPAFILSLGLMANVVAAGKSGMDWYLQARKQQDAGNYEAAFDSYQRFACVERDSSPHSYVPFEMETSFL